LVQLVAPADRTVAQRDVVRLRSGEVLLRGAEALTRHQAKIRLEASPQQHAGSGLAVCEHALDETIRRERLHQGGWGPGGNDVDVAAGFAAAAQAPDGMDLCVGRMLAESSHERRSGLGR